jgi:hypothetical protein
MATLTGDSTENCAVSPEVTDPPNTEELSGRRARRSEAAVDFSALIAYVSRIPDELEQSWAAALDRDGLAALEERLLSDWQAVVAVIQMGGNTSDAELSELGLDSTVPEDPLPLEAVANLVRNPDLQERRRQLQQAQLCAFELTITAVQWARRVEPRPPDRITGEAAASWFESGAFALIRSRARLLVCITDILEQVETELVRAAHGDSPQQERALEVPRLLQHRQLAAGALAHGDVEASLLHSAITVRRLVAEIAGIDASDVVGPLATWLGGSTLDARIVAQLDAFERDITTGLVDDLGSAFLVARAMLTVIDRLIAAPPVHEIEQHLATPRAETQ